MSGAENIKPKYGVEGLVFTFYYVHYILDSWYFLCKIEIHKDNTKITQNCVYVLNDPVVSHGNLVLHTNEGDDIKNSNYINSTKITSQLQSESEQMYWIYFWTVAMKLIHKFMIVDLVVDRML